MKWFIAVTFLASFNGGSDHNLAPVRWLNGTNGPEAFASQKECTETAARLVQFSYVMAGCFVSFSGSPPVLAEVTK